MTNNSYEGSLIDVIEEWFTSVTGSDAKAWQYQILADLIRQHPSPDSSLIQKMKQLLPDCDDGAAAVVNECIAIVREHMGEALDTVASPTTNASESVLPLTNLTAGNRLPDKVPFEIDMGGAAIRKDAEQCSESRCVKTSPTSPAYDGAHGSVYSEIRSLMEKVARDIAVSGGPYDVNLLKPVHTGQPVACRAAFEKWCQLKPGTNVELALILQSQWEAWQAAWDASAPEPVTSKDCLEAFEDYYRGRFQEGTEGSEFAAVLWHCWQAGWEGTCPN